MLLISKIKFDEIKTKRKLLINFLINSIKNTFIEEIFIFTDIIDETLPNLDKVRYINKPKYTKIDIINYSKLISKQEYIIISEPFVEIRDLYNYKDISIEYRKEYIIFNRKYVPVIVEDVLVKKAIIKDSKSNIKKDENIKSKLDVIIVSVNYNNYLSTTLHENTKIFNNITVVTSEDDIECQKLCKDLAINFVICDDIVRNGKINKSLGLNKGIESIDKPDWILILDADIIVEKKIDISLLNKETLYTSSRWIIEDINDYNIYKIGDKNLSDFKFENNKGIGFFQLFNFSKKKSYPKSDWGRYSESTWSDIIFKKGFRSVKSLENVVIHLGKPYQKWENKSEYIISENSILNISKRDPNIKPKLAVLTTFFNPKNYINLRYNYLRFSEKIKEKADLFPIELSFTGDFFIKDENVIQIKGTEKNILWQKERLLNIALENLPKEYTNVAWIDCDIIFENENWVEEVNEKLKDYKVLHLFENVERIDSDDLSTSEKSKSIIKVIKDNNKIINNLTEGRPGFAWAIRREVIDKIGFLDTQIIGGGDTLMFYAFISSYKKNKLINNMWFNEFINWYRIASIEVNRSIYYISGNIKHLYHGKRVNRNYNNRYDILNGIGFYPKRDLVIKNQLWEFNDIDNYKLLINFFENRDEDDNIINVSNIEFIYIVSENFIHIKDEYKLKFKYFNCIKSNNKIDAISDAIKNGYKNILIIDGEVFNNEIDVYIQYFRNIEELNRILNIKDCYNNLLTFIKDPEKYIKYENIHNNKV